MGAAVREADAGGPWCLSLSSTILIECCCCTLKERTGGLVFFFLSFGGQNYSLELFGGFNSADM